FISPCGNHSTMLIATLLDALTVAARFLEPAEVVLVSAIAIVASAHAILYKRDSRAAVYWVGLIFLVPVGGALLYLLFGVNRIRRRAVIIRSNRQRYRTKPSQVIVGLS